MIDVWWRETLHIWAAASSHHFLTRRRCAGSTFGDSRHLRVTSNALDFAGLDSRTSIFNFIIITVTLRRKHSCHNFFILHDSIAGVILISMQPLIQSVLCFRPQWTSKFTISRVISHWFWFWFLPATGSGSGSSQASFCSGSGSCSQNLHSKLLLSSRPQPSEWSSSGSLELSHWKNHSEGWY